MIFFRFNVQYYSVMFLLILSVFSVATHASWQISQITNNSTDDSGLQMAVTGTNLLWRDYNNSIYYFYNGTTISTVYSGTVNYIHLDGSTVVYTGWDGSDWEIYKWVSGTTTQLTNDTFTELNPRVSGSNITWEGDPSGGSSWEIYLNGVRLTNNGFPDTWNVFSGSYIAWFALETYGGGSYNYVRMYNGSSTFNLSAAGDQPSTAGLAISGNRAIWLALYGGSDREIAYYNGTSTSRLTNNAVDEYGVGISGANAVWTGVGGSDGGADYEIFFYNGSTISQLTVNSYSDSIPAVSGSRVIWLTVVTGAPNTYYVYLYDGSATSIVTTSTSVITNLCINGTTLAWMQYDGTDYEIFRAVAVTPTSTPSATATFSPTFTPTFTPTYTPTYSPSITQTPTLSPTLSPTSTNTNSPTVTLTVTLTPTNTPTVTLTPEPSFTPTISPTPTTTPLLPIPSTNIYGLSMLMMIFSLYLWKLYRR